MSNFDVHPEQYQAQLTEKSRRLVQMFEGFGVPELEIFESPPTHYRMRAEFRVWHDQGDLYYIMFDKHSKERIRVDCFPQASRLINRAMPALMDVVRQNECLRKRLFQVDFLSTLSGEILVSLLYHRQLDDEWLLQASALKETLNQAGLPLDLIGRSRKMKRTLHRDFVIERLEACGRTYIYQQYENSFTQPNAAVAQHMLSWAIDCTRKSRGDLLELYCGNGHFSLALAQNFGRVLATEVAKHSVRSAHYNIEANAIDNVQVVRLSAEEVVEAMDGVREFRRLRNAGVDLSHFDFSTVFVDPPRAGMDPEGCAMVQRFEKILYVSCNPETLKENLEILSRTHRVTRFAFFDQFPYTEHMEAGMLLERRAPLKGEGIP